MREIKIGVMVRPQHAAEHDREPARRIVGLRPSRRGAQLGMRGLKPLQINMMLATGLVVGRRVELEVDLVEPAGERERKRTEDAPLDAFEESSWQTEPQQRVRTSVQPVGRQLEHTSDILHSLTQGRWQRTYRRQRIPGAHRNEIEILGRSIDEPDQQEAATADGNDLVVVATIKE